MYLYDIGVEHSSHIRQQHKPSVRAWNIYHEPQLLIATTASATLAVQSGRCHMSESNMTTKEHITNSPDELETFIAQLAAEYESTKHHLRVVVFAPLAHEDGLAQCRDPKGDKSWEYLIITPLSRAWRQQWKNLSTTKISHVTFDLTVPEPDDGVEGVEFYSSEEYAGIKLHIPQMGTQTLIDTMALEMHMRSKGSVKMDAVWDGRKGPNPAFDTIKDFIEALETGGESSRRKEKKVKTRGDYGG